MTVQEAMKARHSVRQYEQRPLAPETVTALQAEVDACNQESGLHIQLVTGEAEAFQGLLAHYGSFRGVTNYLAMVGQKGPSLEEQCGWYGERLVLKAQQLGLNTCWVALTYSKGKATVTLAEGETLCIVIALGYGVTQGTPHKSKPVSSVSKTPGPLPEWFQKGVEAALLAPTAMNQQRFRFSLEEGNRVAAQAGLGFCTKVDLGIAKYHFTLGAGSDSFTFVP